MSATDTILQKARTKIVATVGPACAKRESLRALVKAGVDVFRINMAHGSREEHDQLIDRIRAISVEIERPLGILVDLAGPKIRLGQLVQDPTKCEVGAEFHLIRGEIADEPHEFTCTYAPLIDELEKGDTIMLADGTVAMQVDRCEENRIHCRVTMAGVIHSRQGINLPGVSLSVAALTDVDLDNAEWAAQRRVDFIGLSFVRNEQDVQQLKAILDKADCRAAVIAKIEKPEALERLEQIVNAADGVMVARGDLGVEIDVAEIAVAQKRIIGACNEYGKPVIVATQMLESMHHSARPTRAEATDVANAILDGADACMLSGETAIGEFPRETVEMMNRIMVSTESLLWKRVHALETPEHLSVHAITSAVVLGATQIAEQLGAKLVVIATRTGKTALAKAKKRSMIPTIGVSDSEETLRQMCLYWGITPLRGAPVGDGPQLREFVDAWGSSDAYLVPGDCVVLLTGAKIIEGAHDVIVVHEVAAVES